jgi:hypothetical protein
MRKSLQIYTNNTDQKSPEFIQKINDHVKENKFFIAATISFAY